MARVKQCIKKIVYKAYIVYCALTVRVLRKKYVLLLAPYHGNIGDHAIALAEKQYFEEKGLKLFEVRTKTFDGNEKLLASLLPQDVTVIVCGGGFLGALWPREEYRVRKIFDYYGKNRIIVFPQTVTFYDKTPEDIKFFEESRKIYSRNKQLTIFVRDERSFEYMHANMPEVNVKLVPDIVTILKYKNDENVKRNGIVYCFRRDLEKALSDDTKEKIKEYVERKYSGCKITNTDTVADYHISIAERKQEVDGKLALFAGSKLVITDRLHGMVMAAITDTPCIAFGNTNGKVKGVYAWIKNNSFIKYVDTFDQFKDALDGLDLDKAYKYCIDESLFTELNGEIGRSDGK